jgi:hypothetical protein
MHRACSTHYGEGVCVQNAGGKARRKGTTRKRDVGGRIILKWVIQKKDQVVKNRLIWLRIDTSGVFLWTR